MISVVLLGLSIGILGSALNWSYLRIIVVGGVAGFILGVAAHAAPSNLKDTTVHIAVGTGFIAQGKSGNTYLVTNWHVCNAGSWAGKMHGNFEGGEHVSGPIVKLSPLSDLCASKLTKRTKSLKIASSLAALEQVYTRGYPFGVLSETSGQFAGVTSWSFTYPIEEVGTCFKGSKPWIGGDGKLKGCTASYTDNMTNMYSRPGSSGSPVVNEAGELVGVMSSWDGNKDSGGMVTLEQVREFLNAL